MPDPLLSFIKQNGSNTLPSYCRTTQHPADFAIAFRFRCVPHSPPFPPSPRPFACTTSHTKIPRVEICKNNPCVLYSGQFLSVSPNNFPDDGCEYVVCVLVYMRSLFFTDRWKLCWVFRRQGFTLYLCGLKTRSGVDCEEREYNPLSALRWLCGRGRWYRNQ